MFILNTTRQQLPGLKSEANADSAFKIGFAFTGAPPPPTQRNCFFSN